MSRKKREHLLDVYGVMLHAATTPQQVDYLRRRFEGAADDLDHEAMGAASSVLDTSWDGQNRLHVIVYVHARKHDGDSRRLVDTIAHEASHAAGMILNHVGADSGAVHEHVAYLVGWIAGWVWDQM